MSIHILQRLFRLRLLLVCLLAFGTQAQATHIVGGEFALAYKSPGRYNLTLTIYFDAITGSIGAIDEDIRCFIYAKNATDDTPLETILMPLDPEIVFVEYTNPECQFVTGAVRTRVLTYQKELDLVPSRYADPGGYYVVWERCCRNGTIVNIDGPGQTGQAFYLEFPPLVFGPTNAPQKNSSPTLFKPLSDFACIGQPFLFDFSGTDPDGDRLEYSLVPPFAGNTTAANPGQYPADPAPPRPAPYALVKWAPGYSDFLQVGGPQPLRIDATTGVLSMVPARGGLFVFAIECREYRGSRYLGKVRREFQVFIQDCAPNTQPTLIIKNTGSLEKLRNWDTLYIPITPAQGCVPLNIGDSIPDNVFLSATSPDLPANAITITAARGSTGAGPFPSQLCFSNCLAVTEPRYARLVLRAKDNACPKANTDSLQLILALIPTVPAPALVGLEGYKAEGAVLSPGDYRLRFLAADSTWPITGSYFTRPAFDGTITVGAGTGSANRKQFDVQVNTPCGGDSTASFVLYLVGTVNRCGSQFADTIQMPIQVVRKKLTTTLEVRDSAGAILADSAIVVVQPGQYVDISGTGAASDSGNVLIEATSANGPLVGVPGFAQGPSPQTWRVRWQATCTSLTALPPDTAFVLTYTTTAIGCTGTKQAIKRVQVKIRDTNQDTIRLSNIITLNGDDRNASFRLYAPLPVPNCAGGFEGVEIYSRWGRKVFASSALDFAFTPDNNQPALYFYRLRFRGKAYRGWLEATGQ